MNHWRIRRYYGFGVGRVLLRPYFHRHPPVPGPFFAGLRRAFREMLLGDGAPRRLVTTAPVFAIALAVLWILVAKLMLVPGDYSDIELVLMRTVEDRFEPLPRPLPEPVVEVRPPRPTLQVAEVPAEVKPPEPVIEIPTPKPPPRTRVALVEPPPPRVRPELSLPSPQPLLDESRVHLSRPAHRTRPEIVSQIRQRPVLTVPAPAAPATDVSPVPSPRRIARFEAPVAERERARPALTVDPLQAALEPAPRPVRTDRASFAPVAERTRHARPTVQVNPPAATPEASGSLAPSPRARRVSAAPVPSRSAGASRPALAAVSTAVPELANEHRAVRRPGHHPPSTKPKRRTSEVAALATPGMVAALVPGHLEAPGQRSSRVQYVATSTASSANGSGESLQSVPLGSLAACVSDRLEDSLKQRLIAVVRMRQECRSAAGTYRFVETKNLNAFLMWIDRAPGRGEADRCEELRLALHCLHGDSA